LIVRNAEVEYGSFITQSHVDKVDKVAVIGSETASTLFGQENPIGKDIRVGSAIMTVVGVMKSKGSTMGMSQDSTVFVPISSAQKRLFGTTYLSSI
jgi:putative ABC transport system permease protein